MANQYPSLGLDIDLNKIVQLNSALDRAEAAYLRVGRAREKAEGQTGSGARVSGAAAVESANKTAQAAQRASAAEQRAFNESLASARQMMAFRQRMTSQRVGEESAISRAAAGSAQAAQRAAEQTMHFRVRMARQQAAEMAATSRAEQAALRNHEAAVRREATQTAAFLRGVYRATAAERAAAAQRAAAAEVASSGSRMLSTYGYQGGGGGSAAGSAAAGLLPIFSAVRAAGSGFIGFLGSLRNALGQVRQAFFDVKTVVAILLAGMIVSPLVHMADAMTALEARTRIYAARASDVPYTFEAIYRTAQDARAPLEAISMLYTRLAPLAERLGKSQTDILRTTSTVAKSFAIGGATPAEATSSSQQLAQALAANRLGGDELRSLSENAPVLLLEISRALGMNTGEFIKWAHSGKANAEIIVGAIDASAARIDSIFKTMPVTISQATTVMGNAFQHLVGEVNTATGASVEIAAMILQFGRFLEAKSTTDALIGSIQTLGQVFTFLGSAVQTVVSYTPSIIAMVAALAAAAALPAIYRAVAVAMAELTIATVYSGRAVTAMNLTVSAGQAAMVGLRTAVASAAATLGALLTPMNLLLAVFAVGVITVNRFANAERAAAAAAGNLRDSQEGAINALSNAMAFSEKYGIANDNLKTSIDEVIAATKNGSTEAIAGGKANDAAMEAAQRRAEVERILAVNILRRAAADAMARGAEAQGAAKTQMGMAGLAVMGARSGLFSRAERELRYRSAATQYAGATATSQTAAAEFGLAAMLNRQRGDLAGADLTVTKPEDGSGDSASSAAGKEAKGMAGAINAIAKMRAEVVGLRGEIASVSANPLSILSAQIRKAGDEAAAARTAGKASPFAEEARGLAMQKEELTIRLGLLQASAAAEREAANESAAATITARGRAEGMRALNAYYAAGNESANAYADALDAQAAAESGARISNLALSIARRYNVESIDLVSAAYQKATGATKEDADALQMRLQRELAAATAAETNTAAIERETRATERLTAANRAYFEYRVKLDRLAASAGDTTSGRELEASILIIKEKILVDLKEEGVTLSDKMVDSMARQRAIMDQLIEKAAKLKIQLQDAVRSAFIDTGKMDLSSLRTAIGRSIREAVYDNLIAKPMTIIVNAVVDVVATGIEAILTKILGARDAEGNRTGGELKKLVDKLPESLKAFATKAASVMKDATTGYVVATTVMDMIGVKGSNKDGGKSQAIMDMAASVVGSAVGGPIGSAIAVAISRILGPAIIGKESNFAAKATFENNGTSFTIGGSKRNEETTAATSGVAKSVMGVIETLRGIGIEAGNIIDNIAIGSRDPTHIRLKNGMDVRSAVGDPEAALKAASLALVQYGTYADQRMKALVDQMVAANANFDEIAAKLDGFIQAQKIPASLAQARLQFSDPRAYNLSTLRDQQVERRKTIKSFADQGFYTTAQLAQINQDLTALEHSEIADVVNRFSDSMTGAVHSLQDFVDAQKRIKEYADGLLIGALSPLSPETQLQKSGQTFFSTVNSAKGGDYSALDNLTDVASTYLQQAQQFYGSSEAYATVFQTVQDALNNIASQEFTDPTVSAIEDATAALEEAIAAGSLAIVDAIAGNTPANENVPLVATPAGGYGGSGGGLNGDVTFDGGLMPVGRIVQELQALQDGQAKLAEAVVASNNKGFARVADTMEDSNGLTRILRGGQVAQA